MNEMMGMLPAPGMDRGWTVMDFVTAFEDHQVERIRRALLAYRAKHGWGDVRLTKELRKYLPGYVTYDSALKNVQRLRKGERIRGTTFLNACVQLLDVAMVTPPEEELGLAMNNFIGFTLGPELSWDLIEGDYEVRVLGERKIAPDRVLYPNELIGRGIAVKVHQPSEAPKSLTLLTIVQGEGKGYGTVRERRVLKSAGGLDDHDDTQQSALALGKAYAFRSEHRTF